MEDTMVLIERSHHGDKKAREQLVEENMGLIWSIVKRFTGRGTDMEDLFQIGAMGLIKAIDKFDTSFEVKFSTYAVPMIAGEIKRFLRDDGIVKVSRTLKENCWKIHRETEDSRHTCGTLVEVLTCGALQQAELIERVEGCVSNLVNKLADRLRRVTAAAECAECRHSRVIPSGNHLFVDHQQQVALAHQRIVQV